MSRAANPEQAREEDRELLRALPRRRRHDRLRGADRALSAAGALARPPLRRSRRAARGHRAGRRDRPDQGDRPLRPRRARSRSATYATPNMVGEIKRHFRDKGWAIRVPRALQELNASMSGAIERLDRTARAARRASPRLPRSSRRGPEEVLEAMEVGPAYSTVSLSAGPSGEERARPARDDRRRGHRLRALEDRAAPASRRSSGCVPREREILRMRFEEGLPQTQIALRRDCQPDARVAPDSQIARDHEELRSPRPVGCDEAVFFAMLARLQL